MHVEHSEVELELLVTRLDRRELDHRQDQQRDRSWHESRQQRLIDTILRDWCIPAVHVAEDPAAGPDVVLDGSRRLHAIARFFHDDLPCSEVVPLNHDSLGRVEGLRFSDLPADVRRRIRRFRLTVVTISDYHDAELDELLDRLEQPVEPPPPQVPAPRTEASSHRDRRPAGTHRVEVSPEPIFDQVSAWFADLTELERSEAPGGLPAPRWSSPADLGRAAAEAAMHDQTHAVTSAGLPKRQPWAQLVPGTIDPTGERTSSNSSAASRSAEDVSERLASYQDGVDEGRQDRTSAGADAGPGTEVGTSAGPTPAPIFDTEHHR